MSFYSRRRMCSGSFISVNYDSTTDQLTASGFALQFTYGPSATIYAITDGSFSLTANIANDGTVLPGGTFSIGGVIAGTNLDGLNPIGSSSSGSLLTGTLSNFGFGTAAFSPLEFEI